MSTLPPLYQRLIEARDAFWNVHHYQTPREALGHSQALVETVNRLIDTFILDRQAFKRANSKEEVVAIRNKMKQTLDAYLLDAREWLKRLEEHTGDSGLAFYVDALDQLVRSEIGVEADAANTSVADVAKN